MEKTNDRSEIPPLLEVRDLSVNFKLGSGQILRAVDGVDFDIRPGEIVGLVGESGSGKTVFSLALLQLIQSPGYISSGRVIWQGRDLLALNAKGIQQIRGKEIAMIFQNPQSSLNPVYTIGTQMVAVLQLHRRISKKEAEAEAIRLLELVKIPYPQQRVHDYPHQFSGGMCQRIVIAMAIACRQPRLLIADEPTTALDVTIQSQIIDLLLEVVEQLQMSLILVSHDLGVVAQMCDRVAVMYSGRIVEVAPVGELYSQPLHPYTEALLASIPVPDPLQRRKSVRLAGDIPSPLDLPSGCRFRSRCPKAFDRCGQIDPCLSPVEEGSSHQVACLLYL
jgi:oligopeptide/dipeptide ABC transporter ATP-binding protein